MLPVVSSRLLSCFCSSSTIMSASKCSVISVTSVISGSSSNSTSSSSISTSSSSTSTSTSTSSSDTDSSCSSSTKTSPIIRSSSSSCLWPS
uniref:Putative cell wall integrity and stress response component 1 n=1 Tax=Anopheles marajoara TaxID=58244 RepID=A0A2M4C4P7_9DIPT